ncbi:hypothetical protein Tcan_09402 [Toxocara canis]|uniref:Uncharacterized protein n=1 Tax=Toxocara canis TaxID=6265 RepID=A0A0B2UMB0_TOXCA|nr:hypothetical protein Tcan_09402 [Toxocara canis]
MRITVTLLSALIAVVSIFGASVATGYYMSEQNHWHRVKRQWYDRYRPYPPRGYHGRYGPYGPYGSYGMYGRPAGYGPGGNYGQNYGGTVVSQMDVYGVNLFPDKQTQGGPAGSASSAVNSVKSKNYPSILGGGEIGNMKVLELNLRKRS